MNNSLIPMPLPPDDGRERERAIMRALLTQPNSPLELLDRSRPETHLPIPPSKALPALEASEMIKAGAAVLVADIMMNPARTTRNFEITGGKFIGKRKYKVNYQSW